MRPWLVGSALMLAGCATSHVPLQPMAPPPLPPVQVMVMPPEMPSMVPPDDRAADPVKVINQANGRALIVPQPTDFDDAEVRLPYRKSAVYRLDGQVQHPMRLTLQPGERLRKYVSGEKRWIKDIFDEGDPVEIFLTPTRAKLRTVIHLRTTLGSYALQMHSHEDVGLVAVSWRHPQPVREPLAGLYGVGYGTSSQGEVWAPRYVWEYRGQTYALFDERVPLMTPPTVRVLNGEAHTLINYGPILGGRVYVIDRLLDAGERFEFTCASQPGVSVTVARVPETRYVHCPGAEECRLVQRWTRRRDGSL